MKHFSKIMLVAARFGLLAVVVSFIHSRPVSAQGGSSTTLLYPWTVSEGGYDTLVTIANISKTPNSTGTAGACTLYAYGTLINSANPSAIMQTTPSVPAGQVLTYVLSSGSQQWGLDNRLAGFVGYIIAKCNFQAQGFAAINAIGAGPLTPGVSESYLAVVEPENFLNGDTSLSVTPGPLPDGKVGQPYSQQLVATGGTPPYNWTVAGGAIPPGLTLSAGGLLSGTPASPFLNNFYVEVRDSGGQSVTPGGYYFVTIH